MANDFKQNSDLHSHKLKQQRLVFEYSIASHATPASKKHSSDIPGCVYLRTEGKTAEADAIETLTWTTAVDDDTGDSVYGILIDLSRNPAKKIYSVTMTEVSNVSTSEVLSGPNSGASNLTAAGNIAIEVAATGLDLSSENPTFRVEVEYLEEI